MRVDLRAANPKLILMLEQSEPLLSRLHWKSESLPELQVYPSSLVYLICPASQELTFAVSSNFVMVLPNEISALSRLIARIRGPDHARRKFGYSLVE